MSLPDADELYERWPLLNVSDVLGAQFVPANGQVNPLDVTRRADQRREQRGACVFVDTPVQDILIRNGKVIGARTARDDIACERVLLARGMWTHTFAKRIGVPVPLHAAEYLVTETMPGLARTTPVLTVADERACYKEDAGKRSRTDSSTFEWWTRRCKMDHICCATSPFGRAGSWWAK